MGYRDHVVIDLSEDFGEGCSATVRDPRCVLRMSDMTMPAVEGLTEEQASEVITRRMHDVLRRVIVDWSVWDIETGEPLPIPKLDPGVLNPDRCPEMIAIVLARKVNELMVPFARKHFQAPAEQAEETSSSSAPTVSFAAPSSSSSDQAA